MGLTLVTPPAVEPLSLDAAKLHLRQGDIVDEDSLIDTLIRAARQYVETFTRRALITQTWDWQMDAFPCDDACLDLPLANTTAVTSITYVDTAGATQTWSSSLYQTDLPSGPKAQRGRIAPAYAQFYPLTRSQLNAVTVRFVAGYGAAGSFVPESILAGIKLLVGHWFVNREAVVVGIGVGTVAVPSSIDALLWPYRAF
jgi:uncharacterized phiE125 gp8 family phage protein